MEVAVGPRFGYGAATEEVPVIVAERHMHPGRHPGYIDEVLVPRIAEPATQRADEIDPLRRGIKGTVFGIFDIGG